MSSETPEEIILPATNGETAEPTDIEYLEEHDPMGGVDNNEQHKEEELHEEDADDKMEVQKILEKKTIVPKKRKESNTSISMEAENDETGPSTSRAAAANKDNHVDENQCRVCTTTDDLFSLFKTTEERKTVADMLMLICPNITIAQKDFMPQFICYPCYGKVTVAIKLKTQCETTERELRKKLSRHKNKVRRPVGYVVVDAALDSDPESEEEPNDDVEFKVSEASASADDDDDSEDSDFSGKKRPTRSKRSARKTSRSVSKSKKPTTTTKRYSKSGDETNSENVVKKRRIKSETESEQQSSFPCDQCEQVFARKNSLAVHKRAHNYEKNSFWCELCGKQFKIKGAYSAHLEKHKNESNGFACPKCDEIYVSNADLKRHLAEDHNEPDLVYTCNKCKRTFVSQSRLEKHTPRCPGVPKKKNDFDGFPVGQDLFKTVAPLTTTYWSDSFSD